MVPYAQSRNTTEQMPLSIIQKIRRFSGDGFVNYDLKSICGLKWNPFEITRSEEGPCEVSIEIINLWGTD